MANLYFKQDDVSIQIQIKNINMINMQEMHQFGETANLICSHANNVTIQDEMFAY